MKIKLTGLLLAIFIYVMPTLARGDECNSYEYQEAITKTEMLIKQSHSLMKIIENPHDTLWGVDSACALLSFDISDEGKAESIRVVRSEPNRVLERAAIHALRKYRFCVPDDASKRHGILLFRLSLDELDE